MQQLFNTNVQNLETYIMFRIKEKVAQITTDLVAKNRAPISLSMGAPTQAPPKFVVDKLKSILDEENIHTYSTPKGEDFFRKAVAKRMENRFGVKLDYNKEIFSLMGSKEGLANIIRGLINPTIVSNEKNIIIVPDPGYASYKEMVKASGGLAYPARLTKENNYMPDMESVLSSLESDGYNANQVKALIINYPSNPLGACASRDYLKSVVDFCKEHHILLISDVAYADMYFNENNKPMSTLEIEGAKDVTVEFHSFSKPYAMTGWRLGWVCGNADAIGMFGKLKSTIDSGIFKAIQKAGAEILNSEEGDIYIKNANIGFKENQQIFVEGLKELGWKDFEVPDATFYLWLPIPKKYNNSVDFANDLMEKSGVVVVPGDAFGQMGQGYFRASIVCSTEKITEVIDRMKQDGFYFN